MTGARKMGREQGVPGENLTSTKRPELPAGRWGWGLEEGHGSGGRIGHMTRGGEEMTSLRGLHLCEGGWGTKEVEAFWPPEF